MNVRPSGNFRVSWSMRRSTSLDLPVPFPPMEAKLVARVPDESGWQYEPKWDAVEQRTLWRMVPASTRIGRGSPLRPCHRQALSTRHQILAVAARQGAEPVPHGAVANRDCSAPAARGHVVELNRQPNSSEAKCRSMLIALDRRRRCCDFSRLEPWRYQAFMSLKGQEPEITFRLCDRRRPRRPSFAELHARRGRDPLPPLRQRHGFP